MDSAIIVPTASLKPNRFQPRKTFVEKDLHDLTESVREKGILQPILVRPLSGDTYEIVAGERRWRAAQQAQLHDVPVVVREMNDSEALELAIVENVQRADLNVIEEAAAYHELTDRFGYTQERIAKEVGKTQGHISNTIRLLRLPESVKALVRDGALAAGHARALLSIPDTEAAARRAVDERMSVRDLEAVAKAARAKPPAKPDAAAFRLGDGRMLASLPVSEIAPTIRLGELEIRVLQAVQQRAGQAANNQTHVVDLIGAAELGRIIAEVKGSQT